MADDVDGVDGDEYIIPLIVGKARNGPYDDTSLLAGVQLGYLDLILTNRPPSWTTYVFRDLIPQLDLLAMHHGYLMRTDPSATEPDDDDMMKVVFAYSPLV